MMEEEYQLDYFHRNGFIRKQCGKCKSYFWTRDVDREVCGDAPCVPYNFIGNPVFKQHTLNEMREAYLSFFERHGHTRVNRYPVVARWRDDIYLTIASIADFQPWVTSGKIPPPANPLTISQPCIRLDDLDSVGRSGRHLTTFEMMAHHVFNYPGKEIYWKDRTVELCSLLLQELGANLDEVTFKENPWMGGGNAGPAVEVLIRGLEVATLVFMNLVADKNGDIELKGERYRKMDLYIVDTGYGLERFVWGSNGAPTIYDAVFPEVVNELMAIAGIEHSLRDPEYSNILAMNAKLAGYMDVSSKANLMLLRKQIASEIGLDVDKLNKILEPVEAVYAIADHSRCLAFMLGDGIIPSNVKAGYLARLVIRRMLRLMQALKLKQKLSEIVRIQIEKHVSKSYPEYLKKIDIITEILDLEEMRYAETIARGTRLVEKTAQYHKARNEKIPLEELIQLYDTHGIPPEIVRNISNEIGVEVELPDNFYSIIARSHSKVVEEKGEAIYRERLKTLPATKQLYYEQPFNKRFKARVLDVFDDYLVLDQTLFYPEGGGQPADTGFIKIGKIKKEVIDVQMQDGVILHKVTDSSGIKVGGEVLGVIDYQKRLAHARHHSATHIVALSARKVLGEHIWQAGAQKEIDKARLDLSHYKRISDEELREIEILANKIVMKNARIDILWMDRNEAEKKFGFTLYQGGVPVGDKIRVVKIDEDVEACGGTHCKSTGMIGPIKILRTERVQDGVERLEFAAGEAAIAKNLEREELLKKSSEILRVPPAQLPETVERFFEEWKRQRKEIETLKEKLARLQAKNLLENAETISGIRVIVSKISDADIEELIKIAAELSKSNAVALLASISNGVKIVSTAGEEAIKRGLTADLIAREASKVVGGGGGGNANLAQGGGPRPENIDEALRVGEELIKARLKNANVP
ncbi:MAG: alanine--tRNA ligase [Methanocellales archaeon]